MTENKELELTEDFEIVKCAVCGSEQLYSAKQLEGCNMVVTDDGKIICRDCQAPSKVTERYWLFAMTKGDYPKRTNNSGKWLIFVDRKDVDDVWAKIKKATEEGKLGEDSKVSTLKPKPSDIGYEKGKHVICVYTYDWTDRKDVNRVREELRKLGITNKLPYKSDEDTLQGKYRITGHRGISKYYE